MKSLLKKIIPNFIFSWYHFLWALLGVLIYNFPSRKLIVVGVTGTNGKTTVVHLITEVLEKSGFDVASLSSIRFKIKDEILKNMLKMTMPGRFKLQKFLKQAIKADCKYMILEVTSEGIKQHRHRFVDFNGVVFTNLTKEHIEAHKGFENYKKAKGKLFTALNKSKKKNKFVILNKDDKYSDYFAKLAGDAKKVFYDKNTKVETSLFGQFNLYNTAAAFKTAKFLGLSLRRSLRILKSVKKIPGRMELIVKRPFKVFVDYAHTSDSLEKIYQTVGNSKSEYRNSKLICVLGSCGGGRDKWKRPEIGKIAEKYCDKIILTNEDPYDEKPQKIIDDIAVNCKKAEKIIDRREAINKALSLAKKNDIVIITGKGSEPWMCVAHNKKIPWDERKIVKEEFQKIYEKL